ncbi:TonB-dependent receptor [Ectopseudomonas mendocina]|uniref:TonB-dependent siderophore receptor n=1 Tax=Ectopseudomonas mendocina TaxID=300 RepID=A0A2R3QMQ5_ECTME|nr:TonB-dependent receptor [Pseudomonas mendocina]AVO53069.1 TonB-dependent siderophore receptor [Pseudomonas mendocina]
MSHIHQHARKPLAIAILGATLALNAGFILPLLSDASKAHAEEAVKTYAIAAGTLGSVLSRFANEAGVVLSFDATLTNGKQSPGLQGSYSVEQGFAQLLVGSGLQAVASGSSDFSIIPASNSGNALELSVMSISGKAPGSITEGTGSYTTGSTSSSTRLNLSLQETPQSITVLTQQRMEDQNLDNLPDALSATTGVIVKPFSGGGDGPQIWARGSNIRNYQVDGVPSSASMSNYVQSTALYDRVEIVKGATGMMSGLGNPSATVNMIRKRPTFEPQLKLNVEAGSWDRYGSMADVSGPLTESGNLRGRFVADYKNQHGWTDNFEQEYQTLYGIVEADLSESTILTLGASQIKRKSTSQTNTFPVYYSNGQPTGADAGDNDSPGWAYYDHELQNVFTSIEHQFDSGWSLKSEFSHADYKHDATGAGLSGAANQATNTMPGLVFQRYIGHSEQDSLDTYVTGPFSLLGREHELIGGFTLSQLDTYAPSTTRISPAFSNLNLDSWTDDVPKPSFTKSGKSDTREDQRSAFVSTRLHLSDDTKLLLGSRVIDWKNSREAVTYSTGARTKTTDKRSGIFIPYAGIVHDLDETWAIYASYTKIFQPHDYLTNLYSNSPIDPTEGTSYETGIKARFNDGALNASLSLFRTEQENLAVWDAISFSYIGTKATTEGVELELAGELAEGWQFSSGYAYSESRNDDDERILPRVPLHSLKTFTTYRLPGTLDKFTIGGGFNWESRTHDNAFVEQGSYMLVNLLGRYDINEHLSASISVNNLFNKEYYLAIAGNMAAFGAPRNVMTSLSYTY